MSQVISSYQISSFAAPTNGTPTDADVVRGNDNSIRTSFNSHDADSGIHFQESTLAARPAAGTANRKWFTTDGKRIYRDNGSSWDEIAYLSTAGGTLTGTLFAALYSGITAVTLEAVGATAVTFRTNSTDRWNVSASGHFLANTDNTLDIGAAGATRPRSIYAGTSVIAPLVSAAGITVEATGANAVTLKTNSTDRWNVSSAGHLLANTDNSWDIGASGATRPRTIYAGTSVIAPLMQGAGLTLEATGANAVTVKTNGVSRCTFDSAAGSLLPVTDASMSLGDSTRGFLNIFLSAAASMFVNATAVVGSRKTGYTNPMTGTANRATSYATSTITLVQLAERVKAIQDDLASHGLIGV